MRARFPAVELRRLELAEHECPWGEMAENYRIEYLAARLDAASDGWTGESRTGSQRAAAAIRDRLFGPAPKPKPPRARDLARE